MSTQSYFTINEEAKRITFYNYDNVKCLIGKSEFIFLAYESFPSGTHNPTSIQLTMAESKKFELAKEICEDNGKAAILNKNHEDNRIRELCNFRLLLISEKIDFKEEKVLILEAGRYLK